MPSNQGKRRSGVIAIRAQTFGACTKSIAIAVGTTTLTRQVVVADVGVTNVLTTISHGETEGVTLASGPYRIVTAGAGAATGESVGRT